MTKIVIYTTSACLYCQMAKTLLQSKGSTDIQEIRVDIKAQEKAQMIRLTGQRTVPQIFINGIHIGGYDNLVVWNKTGKLDALLADQKE